MLRRDVQKFKRMLLPTEYAKLQRLAGRTFTLNASCNALDSFDSTAPDSQLLSFLARDCGGQHVWLHAPSAHLDTFLSHYLRCKARSPHDTSACILVPARCRASTACASQLQDMRLLHTYQKGSVICSAPAADGSDARFMPGVPCDMHVYYDPPTAQLSVNAVVHAPDSLTMSFGGNVRGLPCSVLIDSGAKGHAFVSHACAVNSKLQIDATAAVRYRVADDRTALTYGTASVPLRLGSSEFMVEAHVIDMLPEYDCILGDAWLLAHRAYLDYGLGECVFSVGRQRVRLRKTVSVQPACADDALVISALAVQHALGVSDDDPHAVTDMHLVVIL